MHGLIIAFGDTICHNNIRALISNIDQSQFVVEAAFVDRTGALELSVTAKTNYDQHNNNNNGCPSGRKLNLRGGQRFWHEQWRLQRR